MEQHHAAPTDQGLTIGDGQGRCASMQSRCAQKPMLPLCEKSRQIPNLGDAKIFNRASALLDEPDSLLWDV